MPKGLYFTAVVSSFFRHLISEVTERISTKLGDIFTYDCYWEKFGPKFPGHLPPRTGAKSVFLEPTLKFDWHISATEHDINNVERRSVTGELFLSYALPAADG